MNSSGSLLLFSGRVKDEEKERKVVRTCLAILELACIVLGIIAMGLLL